MGADGKVLRFFNSKVDALFHDKKNPRKLRWTILYRRKHKKGISQEATIKKRGRRNVKAAKAVAGLSYNELLAKKQQRPEVRAKQRDNAIRAAKEKKKANEANKKSARAQAIKGMGAKKTVTKANPQKSRTRHDERRRGVFGLESDTAKSKTPTPYYTTSLFVPHTVNTLIFSTFVLHGLK